MKKHVTVKVQSGKVLVSKEPKAKEISLAKFSDELFNGSTQNYLMRNNGFSVGFNAPEALSGEGFFRLPPYAKRMSYLVDKYPACPKDWMRSEGIVKSFFVPVKEGNGMWLDFNENENHTHNLAIVISVQGINPITGLPCNDAQLEQYIEECPKHKTKFGPDRYCEKCGYKWPKQNYISTTGTPRGRLWIDGFRTAEGVIRQYILTSEKMRGVASNIIGKDRVYAIGLSFFVSKEKKPVKNDDVLRSGSTYGGNGIIYKNPTFFSPVHTPVNWQVPNSPDIIMGDWNQDDSPPYTTFSSIVSNDAIKGISPGVSAKTFDYSSVKDGRKRTKGLKLAVAPEAGVCGAEEAEAEISYLSAPMSIQTKKLEVGAGAQINQPIYDDPERLDFWHDKPESIIVINYATEKDVMSIIEGGEVNIEGHKEGFLKEIPVGN